MSIQAQTPALKSFEHLNTETAEVLLRYKYIVGNPRQYRFNGQTGRFNIDGDADKGTSLTIQPINWRIFEENLFGRGKNEEWAEIIFIDDKNAVSSILFSNSSAGRLTKLVESLYYDDRNLCDVVLTITAEKKENDKGRYFVAIFKTTPAPAEQVAAYADFAAEILLYRADTFTSTAVHKHRSKFFPVPTPVPIEEPALLAEVVTEEAPAEV